MIQLAFGVLASFRLRTMASYLFMIFLETNCAPLNLFIGVSDNGRQGFDVFSYKNEALKKSRNLQNHKVSQGPP